jgi:hypothetical protein
MAQLSSQQLSTRDSFESLIRLLEPGLNLMLSAGDRLARLTGGEDTDWEPPRSVGTEALRRRVGPPAV